MHGLFNCAVFCAVYWYSLCSQHSMLPVHLAQMAQQLQAKHKNAVLSRIFATLMWRVSIFDIKIYFPNLIWASFQFISSPSPHRGRCRELMEWFLSTTKTQFRKPKTIYLNYFLMTENRTNINFPNKDFVIGKIHFPYFLSRANIRKHDFAMHKHFYL